MLLNARNRCHGHPKRALPDLTVVSVCTLQHRNSLTLRSACHYHQEQGTLWHHQSSQKGIEDVKAKKKPNLLSSPGIEPGSCPWQGHILPLDQLDRVVVVLVALCYFLALMIAQRPAKHLLAPKKPHLDSLAHCHDTQQVAGCSKGTPASTPVSVGHTLGCHPKRRQGFALEGSAFVTSSFWPHHDKRLLPSSSQICTMRAAKGGTPVSSSFQRTCMPIAFWPTQALCYTLDQPTSRP